MGIFGVITVILLLAKILGLVTISWLWVFMPLLFGFAFIVGLFLSTVAVAVIAELLK
jgi:hypothetical protein